VQTDSSEGSTILLGETSLSRFDMRFEAKIVGGVGASIGFFHYASPGDYCFFVMGDDRRTHTQLEFVHRGKWGRHAGMRKDIPPELGRWYKIRIEARHSAYRCYLENDQLFMLVDERFTRGRVGLGTWWAAAHFRDILVTTQKEGLYGTDRWTA